MAVKAQDPAPNSYRAALEMGWVWDKGLSLALSCHSRVAASQSLGFFIWKVKGVKCTLQFVLKTQPNPERPTLAHDKGAVRG